MTFRSLERGTIEIQMTGNSCYFWGKPVHICSYTTIAKTEENPKLSYVHARIWEETMTFAIYGIQTQK